jgi:hypothetical protein
MSERDMAVDCSTGEEINPPPFLIIFFFLGAKIIGLEAGGPGFVAGG